MPTYEYECPQCASTFERFQSITEPPLRKCPSCGGKVKRLIGAGGGVIFKGSGFYSTDYRSDSYKKAVEKEKPATSDKKPSETKTESETKSEKSKA